MLSFLPSSSFTQLHLHGNLAPLIHNPAGLSGDGFVPLFGCCVSAVSADVSVSAAREGL